MANVQKFLTFAQSTLNGGITSGATSLTVNDGTKFPTLSGGDEFRVVIGSEIIVVGSHSASSTTLGSLTRGADGTTAAAHNDGDTITAVLTEAVMEALAQIQTDLSGTGAAPQVNGATGTFAFKGVLSPSQITSNQNNYNPTNLAANTILLLSSDASRNITGITAPSQSGTVLILVNTGSQNIVLKNADTNSTAANRFDFVNDVTLAAKQAVTLVYDGTNSRWRLAGNGASVDNSTTPQAVGASGSAGNSPSASPVNHVHAASLTTASAQLGADVTMTNANQYYDGPSVSLAAGTWWVIAAVTVETTSGATGFTAKLWDGTTVVASSETVSGASGNQPCEIVCAGFVSPGSTTTYKISTAATGTGGKIAAAARHNGAGNNASSIYAVRIA